MFAAPVPREVGAKMLIHPLGKHVGTVGGGCGEGDVIRTVLDVLQTGDPETVHVDLTEDITMQALGVCGGIMDVFIERAAPGLSAPEPPAPYLAAPAVQPGMLHRPTRGAGRRATRVDAESCPGGPGDGRARGECWQAGSDLAGPRTPGRSRTGRGGSRSGRRRGRGAARAAA